MRIMGLDYGEKTIGVAVSDPLGWTAQGIEVIRRKDAKTDFDRLREIMIQYEVKEIVVGLPKNMNGSIGPRGETCIYFAESLAKSLNIPVHLWDERLSTVEANRTLLGADVSRKKRRLVVDKIAAGIILQGYIDSKIRE